MLSIKEKLKDIDITNLGLFVTVPLILVLFTTTTTAFSQGEVATYNDPQGRFTIDYPIDWRYDQLSYPIGEFKLPILVFSSPGLSSLNIMVQPVDSYVHPSLSLGYFIEGAKTTFQNPVTIQDIECSSYRVAEEITCSTIIEGSQYGMPIRALIVNTVIDGNIYYFTAGAPASDFYNSLPIFNGMLNSFKITSSMTSTYQMPEQEPSMPLDNQPPSDDGNLRLGTETLLTKNQRNLCQVGEVMMTCM